MPLYICTWCRRYCYCGITL